MKWKILESEYIFQSNNFKMRVDQCELPDGRVMPRYYVMEFSDWVNVFALTKDKKVIFVDQYRHAQQERFLELPGGNSEKQESFLESAKRELLEETGYEAKEIKEIGTHSPNPALQSNCVRVFLAKDCEKVSEQNLDSYEDLEVKLLDLNDVWEKLEKGDFTHSLMIASLTLAKRHVEAL